MRLAKSHAILTFGENLVMLRYSCQSLGLSREKGFKNPANVNEIEKRK